MKPFTRRYQPPPKPTTAQTIAAMRATAPTATAQAAVEALGERWGLKEETGGKPQGHAGSVPGIRRAVSRPNRLPAVDRPVAAKKASAPLKEEGVFSCDVPVPPRELAPNARVHYMAKAKVAHGYRADVFAAVLATYPRRDWPPFAGKVRLSLTFVYADERRRDLDNAAASAKSLIDALVMLGVIRDDGHKVIDSITVQRRTERGQVSRVTVRIVAVGA